VKSLVHWPIFFHGPLQEPHGLGRVPELGGGLSISQVGVEAKSLPGFPGELQLPGILTQQMQRAGPDARQGWPEPTEPEPPTSGEGEATLLSQAGEEMRMKRRLTYAGLVSGSSLPTRGFSPLLRGFSLLAPEFSLLALGYSESGAIFGYKARMEYFPEPRVVITGTMSHNGIDSQAVNHLGGLLPSRRRPVRKGRVLNTGDEGRTGDS
jgi:hypothetical protein